MRTVSIPDIQSMDGGEIIPRFVGTVKKVFEQKTGQSEYGPWFLQNFIVTDGENEITVTWGGEDTVNELEGKQCAFESSETKHGLQGIKREVRTVKGKTYEGVKLTGMCKIKSIDGKETLDSDWPEAPVNAPELPLPRLNVDPGVKEAREHLMKAANLLNLCVDAVNNAVAPHVPAIAQTEEFFQAQVATLFIEASRAGYVGKMPAAPIKK